MAVVLSQIFVEPKIFDQELKASLRDEGVRIGYPFCEVDMSSLDKQYRIAEIFEYYGWAFETHPGYFSARQYEENIEL